MDPDGLTLAAEFMPIFPIIGAIIGLIGGVLIWLLQPALPPLLASTIGLGVIVLMNGAQHVDGLLDFGDGIMCHGSRARKLKVMQDPHAGAGGIALGWIILTATVFAIGPLTRNIVIQALIVSEDSGAFAMVFQAWRGHAAHKGMSSGFVTAMHSRWRNVRLVSAGLILILIAVPALFTLGLAVVCTAVLVPAIMLHASNKAFGGITGDVMGATHEITRLASLIIILAGFAWA